MHSEIFARGYYDTLRKLGAAPQGTLQAGVPNMQRPNPIPAGTIAPPPAPAPAAPMLTGPQAPKRVGALR